MSAALAAPARRAAVLCPQAKLVLEHLYTEGSITGVEAEAVYRVRHLPRRIADLREHGYAIVSEFKRDPTGQRYVRYRIVEED